MDYFVVVTPSYQHFWQIELLIESFKMLKMQDHLLVAVVSPTNELPRNLYQHHRKIFCKMLFNWEYPPANKIACLRALYNELSHPLTLNQPFTMLHTDMVMVGPVPEFKQNICFHPYPPPQETFDLLKLPSDFTWVSYDGVVVFKDVPSAFFDHVFGQTNALIKEYGINWPAALAAWSLSTRYYSTSLSVASAQLEVPLTHQSDQLAPVIHYKTGLPPYFNKRVYNYLFQVADDPYRTLLSANPNFCTDHLRKVILSYQNGPTKTP